jgi:hypothetical protein
MTETPNLFADGKAYERLMGRWSRLAGEKFLDWLDAPKKLKWLERRLRQWRLHRSADREVLAGGRHRRRSIRRPTRLCAGEGGDKGRGISRRRRSGAAVS